MKSMVDDTKIEAALSALAGMPDTGRVEVTDLGLAMRDTGLTVAELREVLESLRWIEASTLPTHSRPVQVETDDGRGIGRYCGDGSWDGIDAPLHDVRRWRELPR